MAVHDLTPSRSPKNTWAVQEFPVLPVGYGTCLERPGGGFTVLSASRMTRPGPSDMAVSRCTQCRRCTVSIPLRRLTSYSRGHRGYYVLLGSWMWSNVGEIFRPHEGEFRMPFWSRSSWLTVPAQREPQAVYVKTPHSHRSPVDNRRSFRLV